MGAIADLLCVWVASVLGVDCQTEPAADLVRQLLLLVRVRAATQQQKHYCKLYQYTPIKCHIKLGTKFTYR